MAFKMKYPKGKGFPFKKEKILPEEEQQRITDRQNEEFLKEQNEATVQPKDEWIPVPIKEIDNYIESDSIPPTKK